MQPSAFSSLLNTHPRARRDHERLERDLVAARERQRARLDVDRLDAAAGDEVDAVVGVPPRLLARAAAAHARMEAGEARRVGGREVGLGERGTLVADGALVADDDDALEAALDRGAREVAGRVAAADDGDLTRRQQRRHSIAVCVYVR